MTDRMEQPGLVLRATKNVLVTKRCAPGGGRPSGRLRARADSLPQAPRLVPTVYMGRR